MRTNPKLRKSGLTIAQGNPVVAARKGREPPWVGLARVPSLTVVCGRLRYFADILFNNRPLESLSRRSDIRYTPVCALPLADVAHSCRLISPQQTSDLRNGLQFEGSPPH